MRDIFERSGHMSRAEYMVMTSVTTRVTVLTAIYNGSSTQT